ncbi:hypothetical protein LZ31DRAFT_204660 [Colletotrichum somersetense]|nr:hypothetical protein LZ31DRAFT_204660 [Colletotrichum somersetense]
MRHRTPADEMLQVKPPSSRTIISRTTNMCICRRPLAVLAPLNSAWHMAGSYRRQYRLPCCCKTQCPSGCHHHYYLFVPTTTTTMQKPRGELRRATTLVDPLSRPRKHVSAQGRGVIPGPLTRSNCIACSMSRSASREAATRSLDTVRSK